MLLLYPHTHTHSIILLSSGFKLHKVTKITLLEMTSDFFCFQILILSSVLSWFLWHDSRLVFLFLLKIFPFSLLVPFLLVCPLGVGIFHVLGSLFLPIHAHDFTLLIHFCIYSLGHLFPLSIHGLVGVTGERDRLGSENLRQFHYLHDESWHYRGQGCFVTSKTQSQRH